MSFDMCGPWRPPGHICESEGGHPDDACRVVVCMTVRMAMSMYGGWNG